MNQPTELIQSGLLELYVMGAATPQEITLVEQMAEQHLAVRQEIEAISQTMESYAQAYAVEPCPNVKPLLLATIAYMERLKAGEAPVESPLLSSSSKVEEYRQWLDRPDLSLSEELEDIHAHLISATPEAITAIAWLKEKSSEEVHHDQLERFLIVEGSCIITAGEQQYSLSVGDYFEVPLHVPHVIQVTSNVPCKVIIQRVAA